MRSYPEIGLMHPWRIAMIAASLAIGATGGASDGAEIAPYRARVTAASAPVHSGPGGSFYATDTLAEGEAVDVYRQQSNGWCAIRPPDGSFSWVFGRHLGPVEKVEMADEGSSAKSAVIARIDKPDVASRIGSRLSANRNAVQVRLKEGEVVQILSEEEIDGQKWYKISPPAGEFRWVHASHIQRTGAIPNGESDSSSSEQPAVNSSIANAIAESGIGNESANVSAVAATSADSTPVGANSRYPGIDLSPAPTATPTVEAPLLLQTPVGKTSESNGAAAKPSDTWRAVPEKQNPTPPLSPITPIAPTTPSVATSPTLPTTTLPTTTSPMTTASETVNGIPAPSSLIQSTASAPPARNITELELRLSRMVAESPAAWNIEPLAAEAKAMLANTQNPTERTTIQNTIAKIDRFAAIAQRHRQTHGGASPSAGVVAPDGTRFDAIGVLRPVNSRRPGAPPFALVDERGQVLSFVTPTAGMNLQPLVGQRIGVVGNRGFIPEFQRAHVVAGRVAPVVERTLR